MDQDKLIVWIKSHKARIASLKHELRLMEQELEAAKGEPTETRKDWAQYCRWVDGGQV